MSAVKKARTGELDKLAPDPKREAFEGWLRSRGAWWAEDLVAIRSPDHKARRPRPRQTLGVCPSSFILEKKKRRNSCINSEEGGGAGANKPAP